MRNWIMVALLGLTTVTGTSCSLLGQQLAEKVAVTQLQYGLEGVELKRADIPLLAQNPSADLQLTLKATNPNKVAASLDNMAFDLFLEGAKVGTGALAEKLAVPAGGSQAVKVLVTIPYTGLPSAALSALANRRAAMTLRGTSKVSTPLGDIPVPIEISQTVNF
jgi:LEA14-like dessication related protein